jgi:hypothetical protein
MAVCCAPLREHITWHFCLGAGTNNASSLPAPTSLQANSEQWDFALNWLFHVKKAGITYAMVAASDVNTSRRLAAMGQPCFEWIDTEVPKMGEPTRG